MSDEYFDEFMAERKLRHDAEARIAQLEAALREIATGLMPEDSAADHHNRYELCAARLCGIARRAITLETEPKHSECICPKCGLRHGGGGSTDGGF
jgi:hypothetical protein